jgi:hypothetical protein
MYFIHSVYCFNHNFQIKLNVLGLSVLQFWCWKIKIKYIWICSNFYMFTAFSHLIRMKKMSIYITTFQRQKKLLGFFKDTPIQISKRRIFCFAVHTMYILPIFHYKFTQPRQSLRLYRTNFRKQRLNCKK